MESVLNAQLNGSLIKIGYVNKLVTYVELGTQSPDNVKLATMAMSYKKAFVKSITINSGLQLIAFALNGKIEFV